MAEFIIAAVKDKTMKEMLQPIFVHNHDEAKRFFAYQLNSNPIWKDNPDQFELYDLGLFDTETGNIIGNDEKFESDISPVIHPEIICKGIDILSKKGE